MRVEEPLSLLWDEEILRLSLLPLLCKVFDVGMVLCLFYDPSIMEF